MFFSLLLLPDTSITETTCFHSCWHFVYEVSLTNIANKTSQNKQHHFGGQGLSYWWTQFGLHDINTFCCTCRRCIHFRLWKSTHGSCTAAWKRGPCRYHRPVKEKKGSRSNAQFVLKPTRLELISRLKDLFALLIFTNFPFPPSPLSEILFHAQHCARLHG